jgi:UDP-GlcNAc:undecaprenyl-phosphate/decaprenyl-phosphate GlcNAc-1-phosphate transferase
VPRTTNYRGRPVLFPLGVILLAAGCVALATAPSRWLVFLCGVGFLGLIDDLIGASPRGWRGHGLALLGGQPSTGAIKAVGTFAFAAYAASGLVTGAEYVAEALVLSLTAHFGNLLDTRPGRSEKALALTAGVICFSSSSLDPLQPIAPLIIPVAVCSWFTLRERAMLGDVGASLIGGMMGVMLVTTLSLAGIVLALAGLIAISVYGEFRSISSAIERVPLLERLDSLGRAS